MKTLHVAGLIVCLPILALAQVSPDSAPKPPPFEPIVAADHAGPGRVGIRLDFDKDTGLPVVAALTRSGPGENFGVRVGDVIIKVDKNFTNTLTQDEVKLALHGDPGTGVELTIQRDDNPKYVILAIERRVIPAGSTDMVNPPMSEVAKDKP